MKQKYLQKQTQWANFPFAPGKWPFFYGWFILTAATVGTVASIPGQTIGVGVFTDKLIETLRLSRTQLSAAYLFGTVASSLFLPFAGTLTDRLGARVMITVSSLGLGASLYLMSHIDAIPSFGSPVYGSIIFAALAFLLIRFFGQGCLTMISRVMIARWFNHRRGLATGISNVFVSYSFNASPAFLNTLFHSLGWQQTYRVLAAAIGFGMALFGWLFYRDNPEQCGLIMDGRDDSDKDTKDACRVPETVKEFTRAEALRTLPFWIFSAATGWQALFMTAVTFHMTSMAAEVGLGRDRAFAVFPIIGLISVAAALITGWISDKIRLKWLLLTILLFQCTAALGLFNFSSLLGKVLFAAGYGVSGGIFGLLLTITWPRYYGRAHLGAISGLSISMLVFASAMGPFFFSLIRDL